MPTRDWLGTTSGDMSVAANYSGGAVPIAADDIRFVLPLGAGVAPSATLGHLSAVALARIIRGPAFAAALGTGLGTPIKLRASSRADWSVPAGYTDNLEINTPLIVAKGSMNLKTVTTSADIQIGGATGSQVTLLAGSLFGDVYARNTTLTIESGCTQAANKSFFLDNSTVRSKSTIVTAVGRGAVEVTDANVTGRIVLDEDLRLTCFGACTLADVVNLSKSAVALVTRGGVAVTVTKYQYVSRNGDDVPPSDWIVTFGASSPLSTLADP